MNLAFKNSKKNRTITMSSANNKTSIEPKKSVGNKKTIVISHYDDNQPISLSLPESLCSDHELVEDQIFQPKKAVDTSSQLPKYNDIEDAVILSDSYTTTKNTEPYSDANGYFETEDEKNQEQPIKNNAQVASKSLETVSQEPENTESIATQEVPNNDIQPEALPDMSEADRLADKKFEEDLLAILSEKNTNDVQREQNNPAEAVKNRDNGVTNDSDQEFKKKLNDRHAIFDQIAQSMKMADTYDFGAIAMSKKLDSLEEETNTDFTQKIQDLLEDDKDKEKDKPAYSGNKEEDDKVLTEDFLEDINRLNELSSEQSEKKQDFAEDAIILEDKAKPKQEETFKETNQETSETVLKKENLSDQKEE